MSTSIQMVGAGFAHTVAPLGTALTERQLQILWRMADEPILCFDGDGAGIRAAHRAADLALPLLEPGKSLRFALLPEGQDPDDLIRARGHARRWPTCIAAARPLVDLIWSRETEAGVFDTPERRAALEARLREIARGDRRRKRAPALRAGLHRAGRGVLPGRRSGAANQRMAKRRIERGRGGRAGLRPFYRYSLFAIARIAAIPISDRLKRSRCSPAARRPSAPRDRAGDDALQPSRRCSTPISTSSPISSSATATSTALQRGDARNRRRRGGRRGGEPPGNACASGRFAALIARLDQQIGACGLASVMASASDRDAEQGWLQALTLHRRQRTLHKDLKDAEAALALDPSEANLARLVDIQGQMASRGRHRGFDRGVWVIVGPSGAGSIEGARDQRAFGQGKRLSEA